MPVSSVYNRPLLLLFLTTIFWGGNTIAGKLAVGNVSPFVVVFIRWLIVSLIMLSLYWREVVRHWHIMRPQMLMVAAMSAFGFTGFNALFYLAAHETTALNIGIIQGSLPMMVAIGAFLVYRSRLTMAQVGGILITMTGVIAVASHGSVARLLEFQINPGDALMLIACLFYSGYTLALRNRPKVPALPFFAVTSTVAAVVSVPLLLWEGMAGDALWPNFNGWLICLYIAIFPSFIAQVFFMRGVELIGPGRAGIFVNLVPIFGAIFAIVILGEPFEFYHALALVLVLGGIFISERSSQKAEAAAP
ncbi:DMT family transporter [Pseudovibrio exalbescens]|uniref:DMT family transporter n=1 Tax=Pseudovibrio exalbescens TaxID=197461 RepID=UPI0023651F99|nr:DMT family transporter [Pseudovibrio exalbescens]MDD7909211.1 DMT family transporter [Pseudovibrio exalbescens]